MISTLIQSFFITSILYISLQYNASDPNAGWAPFSTSSHSFACNLSELLSIFSICSRPPTTDKGPHDSSGVFTHGKQLMGYLDISFLFAYAAAMFVMGHVADRSNLRLFLAGSMLGQSTIYKEKKRHFQCLSDLTLYFLFLVQATAFCQCCWAWAFSGASTRCGTLCWCR